MNLPAIYEEQLKDRKLVAAFSRGRYDKDMHIAAERQFALQILQKNPQLQRCTPESLATALLDASFSGLSLSPSLAHAYLIPYEDQATFAPGYRGLLHLSYRAGTIKSVQVNLVKANDPVFQVWTDELGRHVKHEEARGDRGRTTHAYCLAYPMAGGPPMIEVIDEQGLNAIERAATSRRKGGMVWRGPFRDEMCKKAVLRRASKFWPKDAGGALEHMMTVSDKFDAIDFSRVEPDAGTTEAELCLTDDMVANLDGILQDHGIPPTVTGEWLKRYANRLGYASIDYVPQRLYEQAKVDLTDYADQWAAANKRA